MKKTLSIIHYSLFILIIITLSFCSNTSPQTGTLTGTINLEDQSDHSGIIIGVYKLAELDPDIVEANQKWPHIGVIINQHTEFDHRFGTLVKTGETDAAGYFEIGNIPTGVYNVVAIKDGFGFRYIYNVQINDGETALSEQCKMNSQPVGGQVEKCIMKNDSSNSSHYSLFIEPHYSLKKERKADLLLYPETTISSDISTPTTFLSNHHYIVEQDIIVDDELTIEPGAVIQLNEGKDITSYGTFNAVGEYENFIWFTKNDGFSENLKSIEPDSNYIWDRVTLESYSQAQIQWCKFDWANIGLLNHINGFEISDCIFRDSQCGFKAESVDSTFCNNLLCEEIYNAEQGGIYFNQVSNGLIEKNIINDYQIGMKIKDESNPIIKNNYIKCKGSCIIIYYFSNPTLIYNECITEGNGITITHTSFPQINYNNIIANNCIYIGEYPGQEECHINYNNLNCNQYAFYIREIPYLGHCINISGENNYYYKIDNDEIENVIYDGNDINGPNQQCTGIVNYLPFLTQEYPYAGIQEE